MTLKIRFHLILNQEKHYRQKQLMTIIISTTICLVIQNWKWKTMLIMMYNVNFISNSFQL